MACLDEPTVLAFVGGKLDGEQSGEIDEHLADCRACRDLVVLAARTTFAVGSAPQPAADPEATPTAGSDRYTIAGLVGAGGQALVYTAHDTVLGRTIALKILREARGATVLEEARLAARLNHPHIVAIHDAGAMRDGQLYLAMEYVAGGSLDLWLRKRRPTAEILRVCIEAGRGLAAAHAAGIVHRDIKAANILIGEDGRARVTDFGLATAVRGDVRIAGTLAYMAPEQFDGQSTPASDQFSFAVTVWEALTGALPFALVGDRAAVVLAGVGAPARPMPRTIEKALRRALDPEPAKRWPSVIALVNTLAIDSHRKWRVAAAAGVGLAIIGTTTVMLTRPTDEQCTDLDAPIHTIWNAPARTRVQVAFGASRKPFAQAALTAVIGELDRYAESWTGARTSACQDTKTRGQGADLRDLRNQCLDERSAALRATVDALATADDAVIENAVGLVRGLPTLTVCSDVAWLRERVRPPTDAPTRQRVAVIAEQIATSAAQLRAGKLKPALATAEAAATAARLVGHAPTRARGELALGKARAMLGETAIAEQSLQEAAQLAQRGRDDLAAAEAWIELVKVIGHGNARYDEALRYAGFAEATVARLGDPRELRGRLDYYRCAILDLMARLDDADAACGNAAKQRGEAFGADASEVADVLVVQARIAHKRSKPEQARELAARAIAIRERVLGMDHPGLMEALFAAGQLAAGAGRLDEAEASFARAMVIGRASSGDDSLVMAALWSQQANVLHVRGKLPEALVAIDRSTAIRERVEGKDHADLVFNFVTRGRILEDSGKLAEAAVAYERARDIADKTLGDRHPSLSAILQDLGRLHARLGQRELARTELDRAIVVATASEEPASIAAATSALAEYFHLGDKPREALPYYLKSLETYEKLLGPDHPQLIATLTNLGLAQIDVKDPKAGIPHLERAIRLEAKRTGDGSPMLLLPMSSLGEAQLALGNRAAAKDTWTRALALTKVAEMFPDDVRDLTAKLAKLR